MKANGDEEAEKPRGEVEALKAQLTQEKKKSDELLNRLKYAQADLENYRKRMDKEMKEAGESLARNLLARVLVVQDELDLAAKQAEGEGDGKEFREGIAMVRKKLEAALESVGVERVAAVGMPFDPAVHEAVEKVQGSSKEDLVVEEVRPGFMFRGQLLRPSMVKVELASKPAREEKRVE